MLATPPVNLCMRLSPTTSGDLPRLRETTNRLLCRAPRERLPKNNRCALHSMVLRIPSFSERRLSSTAATVTLSVIFWPHSTVDSPIGRFPPSPTIPLLRSALCKILATRIRRHYQHPFSPADSLASCDPLTIHSQWTLWPLSDESFFE